MATDGLFSLDEIADRLAIEQVIARYVHALDARDRTAGGSPNEPGGMAGSGAITRSPRYQGSSDAPAHPDPAFGRITERSTSDGIAR
jgi:hypothetical protein